MKRAGLGGALWMWGGGLGADTRQPVGFLSPEWWDLMRHAIREADRLGLELNITSGSGWSHSGGPWVSATHSMQNLRLAGERHWNGPERRDMAIDPGPMVRVLAYPEFKLDPAEQEELLADYLPYALVVTIPRPLPMVPVCRDAFDLPFLHLAAAGKAKALVTGDAALLGLGRVGGCPIITPDAFLSGMPRPEPAGE